jgi:hypothetical protein
MRYSRNWARDSAGLLWGSEICLFSDLTASPNDRFGGPIAVIPEDQFLTPSRHARLPDVVKCVPLSVSTVDLEWHSRN